ncbi:MAG: hypothetical protein GTO00_07135 [Deltaproteobacteria bacterium]|nr:hypothetical protein [Deltaproteobacteria bacterium]
MKVLRSMLCAAVAIAAVMLFAGSSFAAVDATVHNISATTGGSVCESCHIPHGATGDRLWPESAADTAGRGGAAGAWVTTTNVAILCGSCHYGTSLYPGASPHDVSGYAYAPAAHGFTVGNITSLGKGDDTVSGSGLPYTTTNLECSTCHNPHDNTVRPFMRNLASGTQDDMCLNCHAARDAGLGLSGALNSYTPGSGSFSMHPTARGLGAPVGGTPSITLSTADFAHNRGANEALIPASPTTYLGGKLLGGDGSGTDTTNGLIGCNTCHSVHGFFNGSTPEHPSYLLSIDNTIAAPGDQSAFCQGCHNTPVIVGSTADHPINTASGDARFVFTPWASRNAVESQTALWPQGTDGGGNEVAVCSSCHSAHYGLNGSPMQRVRDDIGGETGGIYQSATDWCDSCHDTGTYAPLAHHSNEDNYAASLVACADCHSTAAPSSTVNTQSAHRDWLSLDLRGATDRSEFCTGCHSDASFTDVDANTYTIGAIVGANVAPTGGADFTSPISDAGIAHGIDRGNASHFTGVIPTGRTAYTNPREAAFESGGFAAYGPIASSGNNILDVNQATTAVTPGTSELICESCHSILRNVGTNAAIVTTVTAISGWENNLLLHRYEDDAAGIGGAGSTIGSEFCVMCHAGNEAVAATAWDYAAQRANMPVGTHPIAGSTITKAVDEGRTTGAGNLLETVAAEGSYASTGPGPNADFTGFTTHIQSYPAADEMDCDSCHRPHDAADASSTGTDNFALEQATSTTETQSMCQACHAQ